MNNVVNKFLSYVKYDTKSDENSTTIPTTASQYVFGQQLVKELKELGMSDVSIDNNSYVMATLKSNSTKDIPIIGFIAHLDTSPDMSGANVNSIIIENYDGSDIVLNVSENIVTKTSIFPELRNYIGKTLITTDGTTLLGADDKAGVAEIVTAMEYLINHPEIEHGTIKICFTPDEEVGAGADHFDVDKFNAQYAYTVDGGQIGELEYENFNAAGVKITIHGTNVHPGYAKDKMVNSMLIANKLIASLPEHDTPENTEKYEGFYHLCDISGDVEKTTLSYIIRDFDLDSFNKRKDFINTLVNNFKVQYPKAEFEIDLHDQYNNMKEIIEKNMVVIDIAQKAMEDAGVKPLIRPIRGGTDGARLSFMGLPTPNIFTGGHNFHGKYEFIPTYAMEKAVEVIINIAKLYCTK